MNTEWHFPIMIVASLLIFFVIMRIVLSKNDFKIKRNQFFFLSLIVVVFGMLFGKYGATYKLPWWIYYPIPMLMTVILPPIVLKLSTRKTILYLGLSFLSAPFIHAIFSFFLGWTEYMPFWKIPFVGNLI
ncbi:MAG: hypothetical protein IPP15_23635 [Saprospiraceae bacterium]|uniref:Uncharacterized protein n=1 Tax=Candidatus Opimibacter skivensis TaxID=2982028 RepID=A0A9D7SXY3_9BACT|nr:hypothetical protein [Candidatus Opimibacter skivensis]